MKRIGNVFPALFSMLLVAGAGAAHATSLQIAPTVLSIAAPNATSTLALRNAGDRPLAAQVRVFAWKQVAGESILEPATGVAASPPLMTVPAKGEFMVRVVRTTKQPLVNEESYRLIVDEIPDPNSRADGRVNLALRYSVPVFFSPQNLGGPELQWSIEGSGAGRSLLARNNGARHVRLSALQLDGQSGRKAMVRDGLAGYVLPGSTLRLPLPGSAGAILAGQNVRVLAQTETGAVSGVLNVQSGR